MSRNRNPSMNRATLDLFRDQTRRSPVIALHAVILITVLFLMAALPPASAESPAPASLLSEPPQNLSVLPL